MQNITSVQRLTGTIVGCNGTQAWLRSGERDYQIDFGEIASGFLSGHQISVAVANLETAPVALKLVNHNSGTSMSCVKDPGGALGFVGAGFAGMFSGGFLIGIAAFTPAINWLVGFFMIQAASKVAGTLSEGAGKAMAISLALFFASLALAQVLNAPWLGFLAPTIGMFVGWGLIISKREQLKRRDYELVEAALAEVASEHP